MTPGLCPAFYFVGLGMKERLRAAGVHLSGSLLLAFSSLFLVFYVWYPSPYAQATGVVSIFVMLLFVDVVLGPLLTFVVYNTAKVSLKFDLSVIVGLQLVAFLYGLWSVGAARPAWIVFNADRFDLVQAHALDERDLDKVPLEYRNSPLWGAKWVSSYPPADVDLNNKITVEAVFSGLDIAQRPLLYKPLSEAHKDMLRRLRPMDELTLFNSRDEVESVLRRWPDAGGWLPMKASVRSMVVLIDRRNMDVLAVVNLRPWDE